MPPIHLFARTDYSFMTYHFESPTLAKSIGVEASQLMHTSFGCVNRPVFS